VHYIPNAECVAQNFHDALGALQGQVLVNLLGSQFVSEPKDHQDEGRIFEKLFEMRLVQLRLNKRSILLAQLGNPGFERDREQEVQAACPFHRAVEFVLLGLRKVGY